MGVFSRDDRLFSLRRGGYCPRFRHVQVFIFNVRPNLIYRFYDNLDINYMILRVFVNPNVK